MKEGRSTSPPGIDFDGGGAVDQLAGHRSRGCRGWSTAPHDRSTRSRHYRGVTTRPWLQALLLALSLGSAGCACDVFEPPPPQDEDDGIECVLGTPCPDGTCVLDLVPGLGAGTCCGFGGECDPCPGPFGGFECPDGTCVLFEAECCAHGGGCDPGDDGPERPPGSTEGDTDASSGSEDGSTSGSTSEPTSEGSSDGGTGGSTSTGDDPAGSSSGSSGSSGPG